jgi:hypothetical protein
MTQTTRLSISFALLSSLAAGSAMAEPGGCLKYGAVGAVGGHLAHHGVLGAAGGCAVGMYKRHEYRKQQRQMQQEEQRQATPGTR